MIFLILLLGFILRLILINQSFWLDEAISALIASKPFPSQWTEIFGDFQPPLYYIFLHFYMQIPVLGEWFLRLPSVLFGLLTILAVYKFTKDLFDKKTAVIASLLLSVSQFHIYYSQELRMYSSFGLLSMLSLWFFYRQKWLLLTMINLMGIYTSYMYFLLVVPQGIWLIYRHWRKVRIWFNWFLSIFLPTLLFYPWLPNLFKQFQSGRNLLIELPGWKNLSSPPFWKLIPQTFLKFSLGRINFENKIFYFILFVFLILIYGYSLLYLRKIKNDRILYILNWFVSCLSIAAVISFFIPIAGVWRLIFLLPPFLILISFGIVQSKYGKYILGIIIFINIISNLLYYVNPLYQREKWREAVNYIEETDDPVIFTVENGFAPYTWYKRKNKLVCGPDSINNCLLSRRVYFINYLSSLFDTRNTVEQNLTKNNFKNTKTTDFPGVGFVYVYENSY